MRKHAADAGLDDAIIVNTCAVTAEAERQAGQTIRKLRREHPNAKIIVTGCAAQIDPKKFSDMPEVSLVIGNDDKLRAEVYRSINEREKIHINNIEEVRETASHLVQGFEGLARAFVKVQNGCDHRCTFCIVPYGRGPSRSVPVDDVIKQVRALVEQGYREIVFTGVDITAYGADLPDAPTLGKLAWKVLMAAPELPRLRLSSIDPVEVDDDLWYLIAHEPRLMPHLHISMQSGDDMILKRMKRRHSSKDIVDFCARARDLRPDVIFGADIIAGFPTESDAMFANTLNLVKECDITWLHVFTYSARKGTPAARMPQVHGSVRKIRAAQLRAAGEDAVDRHLKSLIGRRFMALVEQSGLGCSPGFAKIKIPASANMGEVVEVECIGREGEMVVAKLVE